jgi:DNA-binding Xre family transcriptional regulator
LVKETKTPSHDIKFNLEDLMWKNRIKSINELSDLTNISRPTLTAWKNGQVARIQLSTLHTLCHTLKCDINDLIYLDKNA